MGAHLGSKTQTELTGEDFTCGDVTHWKQCFNWCLCLQLYSPLVVNNSFSWSVHLLWKTIKSLLILNINNIWLQEVNYIWIHLLEALKFLPWAHCQVPDTGWTPSQAGSSRCRPISSDTLLLSCLFQYYNNNLYLFVYLYTLIAKL